MKLKNTPKVIAASLITTWASSVFSHDGHGFSGAHWHATDAVGFVAFVGMLAVAVWLSRGGK
jgi:hypothetical protein